MALPMHHSSAPTFPDAVAGFFGVTPAPAPPESLPERPVLRVIPGGPEAALRQRQRPEVYHRRRMAVLALVSLTVLLVAAAVAGRFPAGAPTQPDADVSSVAALPAGSGADPAGAPGPYGSSGAGRSTSYVVQPGDTLWAIARSLHPSGDIRPLVDELARRAGPGPLEAGARIDVSDLVA